MRSLDCHYQSLCEEPALQIWDDELAAMAQRWADNCEFAPGPVRGIPGRFGVGQNLASGPENWEAALDGWGSESNSFIYGRKVDMVFEEVKNFIQVRERGVVLGF